MIAYHHLHNEKAPAAASNQGTEVRSELPIDNITRARDVGKRVDETTNAAIPPVLQKAMAAANITYPQPLARPPSSPDNGLMETALAFAGKGFAVFTCRPDGKEPLTAHGFKNATTDSAQIRMMWTNHPDANIGVATGAVSGICVLDVDNKNGKNGSASLEELQKIRGELPETYTVWTPSGGFHLYFKWRGGIRNSADKLGEGLDIRGDGGYVVGPGSAIGGKKYELMKNLPIAELPEWIIDVLDVKGRKTDQKATSVTRSYEKPDEEKVKSALSFIDPDITHDEWVKIGMAMKSWDAERGLELWDEWSSKGGKYKSGERECYRKWESFREDGGITIATLFRMAMDAGWRDAVKVAPGGKPIIILPTTTATEPGHFQGISGCASEISSKFSGELILFRRGNTLVNVSEEKTESGESTLSIEGVDEDGFRSMVDRHFTPMVYRMSGSGGGKSPRMMSNNCSADTARALMAAKEMKEGLPQIIGVVRAPLILNDGRILRKGYDRLSGWFVTGNSLHENIPVDTAVQTLKSLVEGFNFQSPGDRSRALASFLSPAFRFGKFFTRVPVDVAEADKSQSGKTYRQQVIAAAYGEEVHTVLKKDGGVGGFDESFATRLFQGHPFILFDNVRGKVDSQYLESYMTAFGKTFGVRVPHRGEVDIDPSGSCVFMSSNGVETTRDLANRSCIVRIRKQPEGYEYPTFNGLELIEYVRKNQGFILGCIYSVIRSWMAAGRPKTQEAGHDFREWCQSLDWIMQNIFHEAPLMDGHREAKERVSDPNRTFVRNIAIVIEQIGRCLQDLPAKEIYGVADENDIRIPGLQNPNDDTGPRRIGTIMRAAGFKDSNMVEVDGYTIWKSDKTVIRSDGQGSFSMPVYRFSQYGGIAPVTNSGDETQ